MDEINDVLRKFFKNINYDPKEDKKKRLKELRKKMEYEYILNFTKLNYNLPN